jgi:uncharacterized protein
MSSAVPGRRALVDSSASYALIDPRETWHAEALAIRDRLIAERWRLFTTNFLLAETHALLVSRMGRAVAARALFEIDRSATTVIRASAADERRARAIIAQYDDKAFSLTDAISFAVMDRLGLVHAFTFDRHFAQYGFIALTPTGA